MPLGGGLDFITPVMLSRLFRRDPARCIAVTVYDLHDAALAAGARSLAARDGKQVRIIAVLRNSSDSGKEKKYKRILGDIDAFVFPTKAARDEFASAYKEIDQRKIKVIPLSVAPTAGRENNAKDSSDKDGSVTALYIGNLLPGKGQETLIKALGRLQDMPLRLKIIGLGRGPYVSTLKGEAWRNNVSDRVEWLGKVDDVAAEIRKADIGVVGSGELPSFGLPLVEFMSGGVPVVAADKMGLSEIMTDGIEGIVVVGNEPDEWAAALRELVENPELRSSCGIAGAERFSHERPYTDYLQRWKSLYASLF